MPEPVVPARPSPEPGGQHSSFERLLGASGSLLATGGDVEVVREQRRRARFVRIAVAVWVVVALLWWRALTADGPFLALPHVDPFLVVVVLFFGLLLLLVGGQQLASGRSPHVTYRPEQIPVGLSDVVGIDGVKEDVVRSLNLFLAHKAFRETMGGTPRRGLLFEGAPGTGKTHLARAMAKEAGVPFLFVSATAFQSMWYGATAKKIRSYFKALRKAARKEGGAIGFLEEIDAIATARGGLSAAATPVQVSGCVAMASMPAPGGSGLVTAPFTSEGTGGVVNELLVQMQSFDALSGWQRVGGWFVDRVNLLLPPGRQLSRPVPLPANVLLIAATNRADSLDPALLRPGRFDRRLVFELPSQASRRALVDHFLERKAHDADLATDERRDALAAVTQGYSPVRIEHLLDEALVSALKRGARAMSWRDVESARLVEEVGTGAPVEYTDHERRLIATHEAGHATVAWLVAPSRRLEVLTIVRRRGALGLLAHGDREEVFTRSRTELLALVQIAMGGQAAEELFFGDVSTGPGGDLLYATTCAAQMVGAHGMDGTLVSHLAVEGSFGGTGLVGRVLGDAAGREQVEALLQEQRRRAGELLAASRHLVEALRDALLEREELVGEEITAVLEAAAAAPRVLDLTAAPEPAP